MKKKVFRTENAPEPKGPYSQGVIHNGMLYVAGQIAIKANGEVIHASIEEETAVVMENIKAIVEDAGYCMEDVLKTTCYLADIDEFTRFNQVYATYFTQSPPVRSTFQVAALPLGFKVEVDAIVGK